MEPNRNGYIIKFGTNNSTYKIVENFGPDSILIRIEPKRIEPDYAQPYLKHLHDDLLKS